MNNISKCKNFTGYKPCFPGYNCLAEGCKCNNPMGTKVLIINLDAMGDILMTTAQLAGIKRKFPESTICWITLKNTVGLLQNNPLIDKVFSFDFESALILGQIKFDYILNVDKSQRACSLLNSLNAEHKMGFGLDNNGKIIPVNKSALYNYNLGMDDHLKFKLNTRTGQDYLAETFELPYQRDDYVFEFTEEELEFISNYKKEIGLGKNDFVVGFNTGCSTLYPNKKMTIEQHISIIESLLNYNKFKIALFGGPEDEERNKIIADYFQGRLINTPTGGGVRKGACYESIADVVITGDSFGMHLAIALKKYVIVWFGLSCWTEIDLYDRGKMFFPKDLECAPCWKKVCDHNLECVKSLDINGIANEAISYYEKTVNG
jgi:heptosyltransferase-2